MVHYRTSLITVMVFLLVCVGCSTKKQPGQPKPESYGVKNSLWKTLTKQQKDMVVQGHKKKETLAEERQLKYGNQKLDDTDAGEDA